MSKTFRDWDVDQGWLLPPSLHEFVPAGHMAHFVRDTVREVLDLSAIFGTYTEERGYPPYHPGMMVALLLYGYSRGLYSSRQLARACEERVDVMAVTGLNRPDFRTIADFRKRHLAALSDLFVQVLRLCRAVGLVQFGHVAVDGTKLKANASRHKAMSYGRMKTAEPALAAEVENWLARANEIDTAEDAERGENRRGDETPDWMADKQRRLEAIRTAKAALEAEAATPPDPEDESGPGASSGMRWQGRPLRGDDGGPPDRAQKNFTDPDSRILPTRDGFIQGYNGQIAVDAAHQIIVAHRLVTTSADYRALVPLVDDITLHLGRKPREVSGDAGFATETNLAAMKERRIKSYLPPGRARHGEAHAAGRRKLTKMPLMREMAETLRRAGRHSRYRLRKQVVEPVFGQIKQARGFRQFLLRGLGQVRAEWAMICTAHNLLKLAQNRP
ncbi:IS1182 family transposase [Brucella tritici]|uniref:IS1182 family transposase n=1 Tax=Brucella tritici TaxID=94626 RepID=A0A7X6FT27_9HYPH|nr:IS1182 family transposase [Brucella tritici]KAB2663340.1 IS1182 family transposase [Brucella tritici]NKW11467.1 IS1182 family transposase [Brucella tritici]